MILVREIVRILGNGGNRESAAEIGRGMRLRLGWPFIQVKETRFINPRQSAMRGTVVASRSFRLFLSFVPNRRENFLEASHGIDRLEKLEASSPKVKKLLKFRLNKILFRDEVTRKKGKNSELWT